MESELWVESRIWMGFKMWVGCTLWVGSKVWMESKQWVEKWSVMDRGVRMGQLLWYIAASCEADIRLTG